MGAPIVGSGLGGLGGLFLFCAWADYDEKVRKWQERQNAEINAKIDSIRQISAPRVPPPPAARQGLDPRVVPKGIEDGVMVYTFEDDAPVSSDWLRNQVDAREKQLKSLSTEELVDELRRRGKQIED